MTSFFSYIKNFTRLSETAEAALASALERLDLPKGHHLLRHWLGLSLSLVHRKRPHKNLLHQRRKRRHGLDQHREQHRGLHHQLPYT
ncbi:hypothetical protein ACQ86N_06705 [Puia sp. P3]|uniref:hypothetical protein n=1 Tax=Puia sp. P3 TaxID=3423952 RepID=UPI003D67F460